MAQGYRRQRPERGLSVADEAELGDEVQGYDHDREPACPPLPGCQREASENEQRSQIIIVQPQPVTSKTTNPDAVGTKYSSSNTAIRP